MHHHTRKKRNHNKSKGLKHKSKGGRKGTYRLNRRRMKGGNLSKLQSNYEKINDLFKMIAIQNEVKDSPALTAETALVNRITHIFDNTDNNIYELIKNSLEIVGELDKTLNLPATCRSALSRFTGKLSNVETACETNKQLKYSEMKDVYILLSATIYLALLLMWILYDNANQHDKNSDKNMMVEYSETNMQLAKKIKTDILDKFPTYNINSIALGEVTPLQLERATKYATKYGPRVKDILDKILFGQVSPRQNITDMIDETLIASLEKQIQVYNGKAEKHAKFLTPP
jgi:hypothetical protein